MRQPLRSAVLIRCLVAVWVVVLPILAAHAAPDPGFEIVTPDAHDCCPCKGCPKEDAPPACPHETAPPCRSQNSCPRGGESPGTALFLAPTPTLLSPPSLSGCVCWVDSHVTDMAFAPPTPPPRRSALS